MNLDARLRILEARGKSEDFHEWQRRVRSTPEYQALAQYIRGLSTEEKVKFRKELQAQASRCVL